MTELTLRPARDDELPAVAALVARAFEDEPWVRATFGSGQPVTSRVTRLMLLQLENHFLPHGAVDLAWDGDELVGAGLWASSDAKPGSVISRLRLIPQYLRLYGRRLPAAARIDLAAARRQPRFPHWHLDMLAVSPDHQGRGVGSRLLRYRLERLPEDLPAYLEATTSGSARLYSRHGFVELGPVPIGKEEPMRAMWRPAARFSRARDTDH